MSATKSCLGLKMGARGRTERSEKKALRAEKTSEQRFDAPSTGPIASVALGTNDSRPQIYQILSCLFSAKSG